MEREFRKYQHIERFGTDDVQNIKLGEAYVFPNNRKTADGLPIHSFKSLLHELGMYMRNYCSIKELNTESKLTVNQYTELSPVQKRTFELLNLCTQ